MIFCLFIGSILLVWAGIILISALPKKKPKFVDPNKTCDTCGEEFHEGDRVFRIDGKTVHNTVHCAWEYSKKYQYIIRDIRAEDY